MYDFRVGTLLHPTEFQFKFIDWDVSEQYKALRDNLLVTAGARAAYMDCMGSINIPTGVEGEEILARFIIKAVDTYLKLPDEINFDEYIETEIAREYCRKE